MRFTKLTEEMLKKSGWYEGRNIDISKYLNLYDQYNVTINDTIKSFLKEFGDLRIIYPNYRNENDIDNLDISHNSIDRLKKDTQEYYEERTGEYLVSIGDMCDRYLQVYMAKSGAIYATDGDYMTKLGDDYISAFEALCHRKYTEEINDIYDDDNEE